MDLKPDMKPNLNPKKEKTAGSCCKTCQNECYAKLLDSEDQGVVIFRHSAEKATQKTRITKDDIFVVHNIRDKNNDTADLLNKFKRYKLSCPRCQKLLENAQKDNEKFRVCDHCIKKTEASVCCEECERIVKKFLSLLDRLSDSQQADVHYKKIQDVLKSILKDDVGLSRTGGRPWSAVLGSEEERVFQRGQPPGVYPRYDDGGVYGAERPPAAVPYIDEKGIYHRGPPGAYPGYVDESGHQRIGQAFGAVPDYVDERGFHRAGQIPGAFSAYPPGTSTAYPPGASAAYPPGASAAYPPGKSSAYPPGTSAAYPPGTSAAYPPGAIAAYPPGAIAAYPPGASAAFPPGKSAAYPPGAIAAYPPGKSAAYPPGAIAAYPPGAIAAYPPGTTAAFPPGKSAAYPPGASAAFPPGKSAAYPPGTSAVFPPGKSAAYPPGASAAFPPGKSAEFPPGASAAFPPGKSAAFPPGASAAFPPGKSAAYPPGASVAYPPGASAAYPPGKSAAYPIPKFTDESRLDRTAHLPGVGSKHADKSRTTQPRGTFAEYVEGKKTPPLAPHITSKYYRQPHDTTAIYKDESRFDHPSKARRTVSKHAADSGQSRLELRPDTSKHAHEKSLLHFAHRRGIPNDQGTKLFSAKDILHQDGRSRRNLMQKQQGKPGARASLSDDEIYKNKKLQTGPGLMGKQGKGEIGVGKRRHSQENVHWDDKATKQSEKSKPPVVPKKQKEEKPDKVQTYKDSKSIEKDVKSEKDGKLSEKDARLMKVQKLQEKDGKSEKDVKMPEKVSKSEKEERSSEKTGKTSEKVSKPEKDEKPSEKTGKSSEKVTKPEKDEKPSEKNGKTSEKVTKAKKVEKPTERNGKSSEKDGKTADSETKKSVKSDNKGPKIKDDTKEMKSIQDENLTSKLREESTKKDKPDKGGLKKVKSKQTMEKSGDKGKDTISTKKEIYQQDMVTFPIAETVNFKEDTQDLTSVKELDIRNIKVRPPSHEVLKLHLVKTKGVNKEEKKRKKDFDDLAITELIALKKLHESHLSARPGDDCVICDDSLLEIDLDSVLQEKLNNRHKVIPEIIVGENIICTTLYHPEPEKHRPERDKLIYDTPYIVEDMQDLTVPCRPESTATIGAPKKPGDGVTRYQLSNPVFIDKGWTILPTEKIIRRMNIYRMRPAQPKFNWFERNKNKGLITYDSGERFAEFYPDGRTHFYYRNGKLALTYYDAEEQSVQKRFVVYSNGEPDICGRSRPVMVLATFDYLGNGIVFDNNGKIRLKYNQTEGLVIDKILGPSTHWKWHTLNDPPVLQRVMMDTKPMFKEPELLKYEQTENGSVEKQESDEMLAIEFDNFVREKSQKMNLKFKPFQIKMKALKINENFSLRVLDQATIYLIYRDGTTNLKLNIGMVLDHKDIVDTEMTEISTVANAYEMMQVRSPSIEDLQRSVLHARKLGKLCEKHQKFLSPYKNPSADVLRAALSRPLRAPFADDCCMCKTSNTTFGLNVNYARKIIP